MRRRRGKPYMSDSVTPSNTKQIDLTVIKSPKLTAGPVQLQMEVDPKLLCLSSAVLPPSNDGGD